MEIGSNVSLNRNNLPLVNEVCERSEHVQNVCDFMKEFPKLGMRVRRRRLMLPRTINLITLTEIFVYGLFY